MKEKWLINASKLTQKIKSLICSRNQLNNATKQKIYSLRQNETENT